MWVLDRLRGPNEGVPFPILVHPHQQNGGGIYVNLSQSVRVWHVITELDAHPQGAPKSVLGVVCLVVRDLAARRRAHEHDIVTSNNDRANLLRVVWIRDVVSVFED